MYEQILLALDRSKHAPKTMLAAKELATLAKSKVLVIYVHETDTFGRGSGRSLEDQKLDEDLVNGAVAELAAAGVSATGVVSSAPAGSVAAQIVKEANEVGASVIVMGSRGLTDLEGIIVGSTAHKVLHLAPVPVLVAR